MVATKPQQALRHDDEYFLTYYGVVQLHYVGITQDKGKDWMVFFGIHKQIRRVTIVVPGNWV
jgi:hypothetical protein